ncbi:MAG: molybdopterin dehydrogenase [Candidatus Rokubacteria bacterium 13_1_40CM_69_27]|nr:MAG: molybdopterin dehydrogenase [Candidatus Rokubacteria bacterium 13_1_40CM_69_27]OLC37651.1 MAG: molybdopterin dehydrogenase [Candidatus Rokubacteria bacterium 13_1_40CM_4_69_5]OLE36671.1 MAG: molybdopterin dehydrogenase [Candidatus Rokubacteria bacterium 13_1_20CM_2_70_7]
MKPPPFEYFTPASVEDALALLGEHREQAKVLAGGQSLVPLLNFRLARPRYLVDLNGIPHLDYIREEDGWLAIGAMTRQRAVERSALVRDRCPLLAEAMPQIGHVQIRNRGTIGGSLAHADPAAELPAIVAALGGRLVVRGPDGERVMAPERFFVGYLTTALEPFELLVGVRLPVRRSRTGHAFVEVSRRHGDFALVGVAAALTLDAAGACADAALALTGVGPTPVVAAAATRVLVGQRPSAEAFQEVGRRVSETLEPDSDLHASSEYRKHLAGVLTRRALTRAAERARGGEG